MTFALAASAHLVTDTPTPLVKGEAATPLEALVARMAAGDQAALGELYDRTSSLIYGLAFRILERGEDAEEVTSDAYMKAWRHAGHYSRDRGSVAAWLVMMTRSIAIDRIRQRKSQRWAAPNLEEVAEPISSEGSPEQQALHAQTHFRIQEALAELPEEQRTLLHMAFFSGLTHSELAEALGIPLGTIKTRIRLGLQRLRTALGVEMEGSAK